MILLLCILILVTIAASLGYKQRASFEMFDSSSSQPQFDVPSIIVRWSDEKGGRGVFAGRDFAKGAVIEYAPLLEIDDSSTTCLGSLGDYVFSHPTDPKKYILALGYVSLYNHDDNHNVLYYMHDSNEWFIIEAKRNISKGEELNVTYGEEWWTDRPQILKK